MSRPRSRHIWMPDGTVLCKGLDVADVARPMEDEPLELVFTYAEATCVVCRLRWKHFHEKKGATA